MKHLTISALAAVLLVARVAMVDTCSDPVDPHCHDHDSCSADDPSKCSSCADYYYLAGGAAGECVACPANCSSCYDDSEEVYCNVCDQGYGLSENNYTCVKACGEHCEYDACVADYCNYTCAAGYYYHADTGECGQCGHWAPAHCKNCWEGNYARCEWCEDGYYPLVNRSYLVDGSYCCQGYPCIECDAEGKCAACLVGWYLNANGSCQVCEKPGCSCSSAGNDCLNCDNFIAMSYSLGHYVTGQDGEARCCYEGCAGCSVTWNDTSINVWEINNVSCTHCEANWYQETDEYGAVICANCGYYVDGCAACTAEEVDGSQAVTCTACLPGYQYNADTKHCDACAVTYDGCGKCDGDIEICEECQPYYHEMYGVGDAISECVPCDHWACKQCHEAPNVCDECDQGYKLRTYQDEEGDNYTDCNACADGWGGNAEYFCLRCSEYCAKCDVGLLCYECADGYYLANYTCYSYNTTAPTDAPTTYAPTDAPTTYAPTDAPTTYAPTDAPTTYAPTDAPTRAPPVETPAPYYPPPY
jgi:hypothetical protein